MSEALPNIKDIMRGADPGDLLEKLRGNRPTAANRQAEENDSPAEPTSGKADFSADKPASPPTRDDNGDVWRFLVEPVAESIKSCMIANPLLPIFLVENPFPAYAEQIAAALKKMSGFHLINLAATGKDNGQRPELAPQVLRLAGQPPSGVILFCTSRNQLPREFRSLVRDEGYFSIPSPAFERLRQYARIHRQTALADEDAQWAKWIGPQELLVANILGNSNWRAGLKQLASQRGKAQTVGRPRKLDNLYGIESARRWAEQLFNDLDLAARGEISWNEVDRGALFAGPPGTGKTTLARAIASEAGVTFIAVSPVKDWMSAGGLDEAIGSLSATFAAARQQSPAIIFIDEIDSIGNREQFTGQNASWNTAFLNTLLTEMDGFDERDRVIIIGATNHEQNVDAALLRAGRLDRTITLSYPAADALKSMYRGMLEPYRCELSEDDLSECAASSLGLTGADIEQILRGARRRARLDDNRAISKADILDEIYHIPPDAVRRAMKPSELKNTAYHEAGHALTALLLDSQKEQVRLASIVASDDMLGFVAITPSERNETRTSLLERLCVTLAGRAAEELAFGMENVTTGAGGQAANCDLARARRLAENYVGIYGFSERRPNWHGTGDSGEEASSIVAAQYQRVLSLLTENRERLEKIARALLDKHLLPRDELLLLMDDPG